MNTKTLNGRILTLVLGLLPALAAHAGKPELVYKWGFEKFLAGFRELECERVDKATGKVKERPAFSECVKQLGQPPVYYLWNYDKHGDPLCSEYALEDHGWNNDVSPKLCKDVAPSFAYTWSPSSNGDLSCFIYDVTTKKWLNKSKSVDDRNCEEQVGAPPYIEGCLTNYNVAYSGVRRAIDHNWDDVDHAMELEIPILPYFYVLPALVVDGVKSGNKHGRLNSLRKSMMLLREGIIGKGKALSKDFEEVRAAVAKKSRGTDVSLEQFRKALEHGNASRAFCSKGLASDKDIKSWVEQYLLANPALAQQPVVSDAAAKQMASAPQKPPVAAAPGGTQTKIN